MLNSKKLFTKKSLCILIAGVVILALLIVSVATGAIHNTTVCHDCEGVTCSTCGGSEVINLSSPITCPDCGGKGYTMFNSDKVDCDTCNKTGLVNTIACPDCCSTCGGSGVVEGSLWALLPPIIAIGLALITKEVFSSLFIGLLSGAILASDFNFLQTFDHVVNTGLIDAVSSTAGIFVFLIELGIIVVLINRAGGSAAFGEWAKTHVKSKVGAAICTFVLGVLIFIDDYFNCLTVGSVMRPVTDKHKISRSKLAYLIDATAAPICMIAPISSWAAAVAKYAADGEGFNLFIAAIPFNFYSILTLVFILGLTLMKFDFGPMRKHEENAMNGDLFSGNRIVNESEKVNEKGKMIDLILPIAILIVSCVFAMLYVGGIMDGWTLMYSFSNTDATVALPWGGLIALIIIIAYFAIRKTVSLKNSLESIPKGFIAMVPAILILTFATALKNITGVLGAKYYVADLMYNVPELLRKLVPAIIFVVACILSFSTGTSWGTFGILIPIVTYMFASTDPLMIVSMSACLAGSVCGDHCSPISDTTIMSSAGAECEHLNHVTTQIPYAIFVAVISFVCFIVAGFLPYVYVMLPLSIAIMVGALIVTKRITAKKYKNLNK